MTPLTDIDFPSNTDGERLKPTADRGLCDPGRRAACDPARATCANAARCASASVPVLLRRAADGPARSTTQGSDRPRG